MGHSCIEYFVSYYVDVDNQKKNCKALMAEFALPVGA